MRGTGVYPFISPIPPGYRNSGSLLGAFDFSLLCVLLLAAFGAVPYGFGMRRVALIIAEPLRP